MSLLISNFNALVYKAVKQFADDKSLQFMLIYGPEGTGKSTLLKNLYKDLCQKGYKAIITDSLFFSRQYSFSSQENNLKSFRNIYRSAEILIVDNIQFLKGKTKTIEEILYTYEYITQNGGKFIVSLEMDSLDLNFLGEKLASRFLSGIAFKLDLPTSEELELFLYNYLKSKDIVLNSEIIKRLSHNVKDLNEAKEIVTDFIDYEQQHQYGLSLDCAERFLSERVEKKLFKLDPINIIQVTSKVMGIDTDHIKGNRRNLKIVEARQMAIYCLRIMLKKPYKEIGSYFGKEHGAVIQAFHQMEIKISKDQEIRAKFDEIIEFFNQKNKV